MTPGGSGARWLVVGHLGMLGTDVMAALAGREVAGVDRPDIDISSPGQTAELVAGFDVVINCAGFTAVDAAETQEAAAFAVNSIGPANLARACSVTRARLLHISTDYVFPGTAGEPIPESAAPGPRSAYGRTKLAGEWAVRAELPEHSWVLRTSWLYGASGPNFVRTMAQLERTRDSVDVVVDQEGQPTWSGDLARRIVEVVDQQLPAGTYHATSSGKTSWFDFARRIFELLGADPARVRPTTSAAFVRPADRPAYSVLGHDGWRGTGLDPLRHWSDALDAAWPDLVSSW